MDPKTTEITIAAEGVVTIPTGEYSSLIACRTMLDMILDSARKDVAGVGYPDQAVVRMADNQRKLHADVLVLRAADTTTTEGEENA